MFDIPTNKTHCKAVIVGINYYETPDARLYGCVNDGITVETIAKEHYGFAR